MQTKLERFNQWAGEVKAQTEKPYIDNALLIDDYIKSVKSILKIKADLSSKNSPIFKKLSPSHYVFSTLLYVKLEIEELLEIYNQPGRDGPNEVERKEIFLECIKLLGNLYNNPQLEHFNSLIINVNLLIHSQTENKEEEQNICFAVYALLCIINIWFKDNSYKLSILSMGIDINVNDVKNQITDLLEKTESKSLELDAFLNARQPLDEQLKNQLYTIVNQPVSASIKIQQLTSKLSNLTSQIASVAVIKEQHEEVENKIQRVYELYQLLLDNEKKLFSQDYFIQIVRQNAATYEEVMQHVTSPKKAQIIANLKELSAQQTESLYYTLVKGVNYSSALPTAIWRKFAPDSAQNFVNQFIPYTLDSQSKDYFKELSQIYLESLDVKSKGLMAQIHALTSQMADQDEHIKKALEHETSQQLFFLKKAAMSAHQSLKAFQKISDKIQEHIQSLDAFIAGNNGIFVKISNFFARFFSFFKSNTAKLIDEAVAHKNELIQFEQSCFNEMISLEKYKDLSPPNPVEIPAEFEENSLPSPHHFRVLNKANILDYIQMLQNSIKEFKIPRYIVKESVQPEVVDFKWDFSQPSPNVLPPEDIPNEHFLNFPCPS